MDVADIGCVTVEHQLSNTDATTQDVQPEEDLHSPAFVSTCVHGCLSLFTSLKSTGSFS